MRWRGVFEEFEKEEVVMTAILGGISIVLFYLLFLAVPALVIFALVSGLAFGGARRTALAQLASGVYSLLTGGFYLYDQAASQFAKQDNAYLGNALLGLLLLVAGVWLLSVGLVGVGLPRWLAAVLALAGIAGVVPLYGTLQLASSAGALGVALYVAAGLLIGVGALLALRRSALARRALGLGLVAALVALGGFALVGLASGQSIAAYLALGVDGALAHKPPVLEGFGLLAWVLCGVAVYLWGLRAGGARRGGGARAHSGARGELAPEERLRALGLGRDQAAHHWVPGLVGAVLLDLARRLAVAALLLGALEELRQAHEEELHGIRKLAQTGRAGVGIEPVADELRGAFGRLHVNHQCQQRATVALPEGVAMSQAVGRGDHRLVRLGRHILLEEARDEVARLRGVHLRRHAAKAVA